MYYGLGRIQEATATFSQYVAAQPNASGGYYGLALCYASFSGNDVAKAKEYFQLALDKGLTGDSKTFAQNYLQTH